MPLTRSVPRLLIGLACALLSACGGGGSASSAPPTTPVVVPDGSPPVTPGGTWLTLYPSPVVVTTYEREAMSFSITGSSSRTFEKPFNLGIVDKKGLVLPKVALSGGGYTYRADMSTAPTLTAGSHTTTLEVRLCEDDPAICARPLPGSPWFVPVRVDVKTPAEGAKRLNWFLTPLELTAVENEFVFLRVDGQGDGSYAVAEKTFDVTGGAPIIEEIFKSNPNGQNYSASVRTSAKLAPGVHQTSVTVSLCQDDVKPCTRPVAGSPWTLPVRLTVLPATNLTPLSTLSQVGAWSSLYGNAGHTSYVAASFDPSKFVRRWNLPSNSGGHAIDNGMLFRIGNNPATGKTAVEAISEDSGKVVWLADMEKVPVHAPAAANGKVYVTTSGQVDPSLWVFEQATGKLISKTPVSPVLNYYSTPTVFKEDVYLPNGFHGGVSKIAAPGYGEAWNVMLPLADAWSPAVDENHAYAFLSDAFFAVNTSDGTFAIQPSGYLVSSRVGTVVLSGKQMAYVTDHADRLVAFDIANKTRAWVSEERLSHPAYANDVLYVTRDDVLQARSAVDGRLLWTTVSLVTAEDNSWLGRPIVTDNLAFVSTARRTIAIDLKTRAVVWTFPRAGHLSISSRGVLYINSMDRLDAVNLQ